MNQKLKTPEAETTEAPVEQKPPKAKIDISETIKKINNVIHQEVEEYWSCSNGAYIGIHCGCEDATDHPWGAPGASPTNPIYYSNNRRHWCAPIRVTPTIGDARDRAEPIIEAFIEKPDEKGAYYARVKTEPLADHPRRVTPGHNFVLNPNRTVKIYRTLPEGAKVIKSE